MADEAPNQSIPEELRDKVEELYEYFQSVATEKGVVFFTPPDIERMFEQGKEALEILRETGLIIFDVTTRQGQGVWRLPHYIDLRGAATKVREIIDLTLGQSTTEGSNNPLPNDPVQHR